MVHGPRRPELLDGGHTPVLGGGSGGAVDASDARGGLRCDGVDAQLRQAGARLARDQHALPAAEGREDVERLDPGDQGGVYGFAVLDAGGFAE